MHISTIYRPSSVLHALREDALAANHVAGVHIVADGLSDAYSGDHPRLPYPFGLSGGQVASRALANEFAGASSTQTLEELILAANSHILFAHELVHGISPLRGDDVGGAGFAAVKLTNDEVEVAVAADCFVIIKMANGECCCITGFDGGARQTEREGEAQFEEAVLSAEGNKAKAWDLYRPVLAARKVRCSNRLIGQGGYAFANGDSALWSACTKMTLPLAGVAWILLGTDGVISTTSENQLDQVARVYDQGGVSGLLNWRDDIDRHPNLDRGQYPEGSLIEIRF